MEQCNNTCGNTCNKQEKSYRDTAVLLLDDPPTQYAAEITDGYLVITEVASGALADIEELPLNICEGLALLHLDEHAIGNHIGLLAIVLTCINERFGWEKFKLINKEKYAN